MVTTIQVDEQTKEKLDALKIHYRESYNELLLRLIKGCSPYTADRESLIETIEVLSDPETMRDIAAALERIKAGDLGTPLEELEKEL
jgi:hypothetical protein